jgi:lactoylglutathione lyase
LLPVLKLVTLKTSQPEKLKAFYECLGLQFHLEKHGQGPVHFAAELGELVFEIYPLAKEENCTDRSLRLGFEVPDPDTLLKSLAILNTPVRTPPAATRWGNRAVVEDPDGRPVELYWS